MKKMKNSLLIVFLVQFTFGFAQEKFEISSAKKFQKRINVEYADAKTSPLIKEDLASFKTLDFYPLNEKYFVVAQFTRTEKEKPFGMKTSTDREPLYVKYGELMPLLFCLLYPWPSVDMI